MDKLRVIFMGTPEFAVPSLAALIDRTQVLCVVTQPDKPRGRGHKLQPPPVKVFAQENGLPVIQPPKVKAAEVVAHLAQLKPDLIVVVAFGQILSQELLDVPRFGCINVHASLLPKLRGAAPIEWSIIRGETVTGVTTMQMNAGLDTGDMLLASKVAIGADMILPELRERLMTVGADLLLKTLYLLQRGELHPVKQDNAPATYAPLIKRDTGLINWTRPAREIHNLVRGLYGSARSGKLKIWRTQLTAEELSLAVGEVKIVGQRLFVGTGDGALEVLELQAAGSKKLNAADFIRGHKVTDDFTANELLNFAKTTAAEFGHGFKINRSLWTNTAAGSKKLNAADFIRRHKVIDDFTANELLNFAKTTAAEFGHGFKINRSLWTNTAASSKKLNAANFIRGYKVTDDLNTSQELGSNEFRDFVHKYKFLDGFGTNKTFDAKIFVAVKIIRDKVGDDFWTNE